MTDSHSILEAFHSALVEEIRNQRPEYLTGPFTVAEIYQNLVPYGSHRDRIGVDMNADYEDALLRLLAGEGDFLVLESAPALRGIQEELETSNPNTGLYREYAAVDVRLNPLRIEVESEAAAATTSDDALWEAAAASEEEVAWTSPAPAEEPMSMEDLAPSLDAEDESSDPQDEAPGEPEAAASPERDDDSSCRWCRAPLPERENLRFCPFCGMDANLRPCGTCGEELEPGWRFCISCGAEAPE